jgi:phosphoribosylformylglycinamidine synthase
MYSMSSKKPRVAVLRAAGTNCDRETLEAFRLAGAEAQRVHVRVLGGDAGPRLDSFDILAIPGGFSYGDDIAAGKVLAVELVARIGDALREFVDAGKLVIGICNGFQVLVKTGLLPGRSHGRMGEAATLTWNVSGKFETRWVHLQTVQTPCVWARGLDRLELPVAHAEGRLVTRDGAVLDKLREQGQVVFRYSGPEGEAPRYPADPNGSVDHIAGLCDETGRVLGMMPHPERFVSRCQHPQWTRRGNETADGDGLALFRNAVAYVTG